MTIGVLGAGSWGMTLASLLQQNGNDVTLWSFSKEDIDEIRSTGMSSTYLPGIHLSKKIHLTGDILEAARGKSMLVLSSPSQFMRPVMRQVPAEIIGDAVLVNVAKGIEKTTLKRMSEVIVELFPNIPQGHYSVLSGPSHAEEVSLQKATSVVVASTDAQTSARVQETFMTPYFRVYSTIDVAGVELGGSLKNVISIGAGICDGAAFGDNTKAALITRGIAEMRRLGTALGSDPHTFAGLSGLGDLIVTTMSRHSRNRAVGEQIGKGRKLQEILDGMKMVAEGVDTTRSAHALARATNVEMHITHQMHKILFEDKNPMEAMLELMSRQAKDEVW